MSRMKPCACGHGKSFHSTKTVARPCFMTGCECVAYHERSKPVPAPPEVERLIAEDCHTKRKGYGTPCDELAPQFRCRPCLLAALRAAHERYEGMRGERDGEREIAVEWERKYEQAEAELAALRAQVQQAQQHDPELIAAVGRGELETRIVMLCPSRAGVSVREYGHVQEVETPWACTCGGAHDFSAEQCEVQFRRVQQAQRCVHCGGEHPIVCNRCHEMVAYAPLRHYPPYPNASPCSKCGGVYEHHISCAALPAAPGSSSPACSTTACYEQRERDARVTSPEQVSNRVVPNGGDSGQSAPGSTPTQECAGCKAALESRIPCKEHPYEW